MADRIPFTKDLLRQLKLDGYTHIRQQGTGNIKAPLRRHQQELLYDYILVPLKQTHFSLEDAHRVLPIDSTDVSDMLDVDFAR